MEELRKIVNWLESRGYQNPVLYGGALRDLYIGTHEPKDYDFEVNACDIEKPKSAMIKLDIHRRGNHRSDQFESPKDRALRADAPINAISLGLDGRVYAHPNFLEHVKEKVYAVRADLNRKQYDASLKRFNTLSTKYPDWHLVEKPLTVI